MRGWAGPAPCPLPPAPLTELLGGGGMAGWVLPGDSEQGRGVLWQASREFKWRVFLASKFGGLLSRVNPAGCHGRFFWRVISAGYFGAFIWRVFMANETSVFLKKIKQKKGRKMYTQ